MRTELLLFRIYKLLPNTVKVSVLTYIIDYIILLTCLRTSWAEGLLLWSSVDADSICRWPLHYKLIPLPSLLQLFSIHSERVDNWNQCRINAVLKRYQQTLMVFATTHSYPKLPPLYNTTSPYITIGIRLLISLPYQLCKFRWPMNYTL